LRPLLPLLRRARAGSGAQVQPRRAIGLTPLRRAAYHCRIRPAAPRSCQLN